MAKNLGPPPSYLQVQMSKMKTKPEEQGNRGGIYYKPNAPQVPKVKMYLCNNCGQQFQKPKAKAPKAQNSTSTLSSTIIWEMQI